MARHIIWVMPKYVFEKALLNDILITFKLFREYHNSDELYQSIYLCEFYSVHIYKDNLQIIKSLSESYREHENLIIVLYIHRFLIDKLANFSTKKTENHFEVQVQIHGLIFYF